MSRPVDVLFAPFKGGNLSLPNRIVMAPMTRSFSPGHVPNDDVVAYYRRRAEGGVGLILSEGVSPNTVTASGTPNVPNIVTADAKAGWRKVSDAVTAAGGRMGLQIWHEGPYRNPKNSEHPDTPSWSASGFKVPGKPIGAPMSEAEIETAITEFVDAIVATKALGFACAEIHGAHSYLVDSFFWDETNQRTDRWGGSWEGRTRFACEMVRRARAAVGADFPILIRVSQWKQQDFGALAAATPKELESWLMPLVEAGVDVFHLSQRRFWEPTFTADVDGVSAADATLNFAGWAKKITGRPAISVGSVGLAGDFTAIYGPDGNAAPASLDALVERMTAGEFDLIAVGRALLQDPDWAIKVREGRTADMLTFTREALATLY